MTERYFLRTERLGIRLAEPVDAEFVHGLWTSGDVMRFVGFPQGLSISVDEVRCQITAKPRSEFGSRLIVDLLETGQHIGQTKLEVPDEDGICEPDIKISPEHWGKGYGAELWQALIDYAFEHSDATIVQGTPNRNNTASVRMQKGTGMVKVDEGVFPASTKLHPDAVPVPYLKLHITREQWQSQPRTQSGSNGEDST